MEPGGQPGNCSMIGPGGMIGPLSPTGPQVRVKGGPSVVARSGVTNLYFGCEPSYHDRLRWAWTDDAALRSKLSRDLHALRHAGTVARRVSITVLISWGLSSPAGSWRNADPAQRSVACAVPVVPRLRTDIRGATLQWWAPTMDTGAVSNGHTSTHFARSLTVLSRHSRTPPNLFDQVKRPK